jgi:hypothetical protein
MKDPVKHSGGALFAMLLLVLPGLLFSAFVTTAVWNLFLADRFGSLSVRAAAGILLVVAFVKPGKTDDEAVTGEYVFKITAMLCFRSLVLLGVAYSAAWVLR